MYLLERHNPTHRSSCTSLQIHTPSLPKVLHNWKQHLSVQFSSVAQLCLTLCDPMNCSMPGLTVSRSLLKFMSIESVMPSNHLILYRPLLLLPSIFPSIRVFSNESTLHIRWPKYLSLHFSICPRGLTNPQRHHFQILSH